MKRLLLLYLFCLSCSVFVFAEPPSTSNIEIPNARVAALGGTHNALADDLNVLFSNPAGFYSVEPELSVAELTLRLSGPVFTIAGLVAKGSGSDVSSLISDPEMFDLLSNVYTGMNLLGPVYFGYVGNGLGFGIANDTGFEFESLGLGTFQMRVSEQIYLAGGYSFRLPIPANLDSTWDAGFLLKSYFKGTVEIERSMLDLSSLLSSLSPTIFMTEPFTFVSGVGLDLGTRFEWKEQLAFGLTLQDVFTPITITEYSATADYISGSTTPTPKYGLAPMDVTMGVAYSPDFAIINNYVSDLVVLLDYHDMFDFLTHPETSRNWLLKIGTGLEVTVLEILAIRAGFYEGLLATGLGLDLSFFKIHMAMFGSELSVEPGLRPVYNIMLGLEFRL